MAVLEGGTSTSLADVGAIAQKSLHVVAKPHGSFTDVLGCYRVSGEVTFNGAGAGTATVGHAFAFRWPDIAAYCIINRISWKYVTGVAATAASIVDCGFDCFKTTGHTAAHTANKSNPAGSKKRLTGVNSRLAATDIALSTGNGMTGGTYTFDTNPFCSSITDPNDANPALGTEKANIGPNLPLEYNPFVSGEYPLTLLRDEGLIIRNRAAWPAAGNQFVSIELDWTEVVAF